MTKLTLADALKIGRLDEFVAQEEARGIGPIARADLAREIAALIKVPLSEDQTLHSPSGDSSIGKRTRQGIGRHISS